MTTSNNSAYILVKTSKPIVLNLVSSINKEVLVNYDENDRITGLCFVDRKTNVAVDSLFLGQKVGQFTVREIVYSALGKEEYGVRYTPNFNVIVDYE